MQGPLNPTLIIPEPPGPEIVVSGVSESKLLFNVVEAVPVFVDLVNLGNDFVHGLPKLAYLVVFLLLEIQNFLFDYHFVLLRAAGLVQALAHQVSPGFDKLQTLHVVLKVKGPEAGLPVFQHLVQLGGVLALLLYRDPEQSP